MKLALWQGPSPAGDIEAAFASIAAALAAAAAAGAEMAVFPELFLPGYNQPDLHRSLAQPQDGAWERRLAGLCRASGCGLTLGWAERAPGGLFNAATCHDRTGAKRAHYRKIQLFGPMERSVFTAGDTHAVFDLGGLRAALLICYDVEFAHHVRDLARSGVRLLLVPTANPRAYGHVQDFLVPARAAENRMIVAYANYCGTEAGLAYGGGSLVAGPDGRSLVSAGPGAALMIADLAAAEAVDPEVLGTQLEDARPGAGIAPGGAG